MLTRLEFVPERDTELFEALPASRAVFLLRAAEPGAEPYVAKSANLRRRIQRLLGHAEGRKLSLRDRVSSLEYQTVGSDFEATFALYRVLKTEFPSRYQDRLRLRPAPLLQLIKDNAYPRLAVTSRIRSLRGGSAYFGPFATRSEAEQFANDSLDFFGLRRCTEDLNPDPSFPGCVYSEMKMCLAPCFRGCTDERYAEESGRVERYLETRAHSLVVEISRARDEASEQLEFEKAANAHAKLEKVKATQSRVAEIVRRIDRLNALMIQPSSAPEHVSLFRITGGMIADPVALDLAVRLPGAETKVPQSMEARIGDALRHVEPVMPKSAQEWMEHLSILKSWYYRTSKIGEIFFEDESGELPMRRVVRAVGRVFKGEKPAADLSETAGDYWKFRGKEVGL